MPVPLTVHTIWIQDPSSGRTFGVGEWLSILSLLKNTEYRVLLHTNLVAGQSEYDPYRISHDRFLINQRTFDLTWHGVRMRPANLSDIERVRILYEHGGNALQILTQQGPKTFNEFLPMAFGPDDLL